MVCSFVDFEEIIRLLSKDIMQNIFIGIYMYMYNKIRGSGAH